MPRATRKLVMAWLLSGGLGMWGSTNGASHWEDENHTHDRARRAVERGEALPATQLVQRLREEFPGELVAMEYEFEFGCWVYEFVLLDPQGRIRKIHMDAKYGTIIKVGDD